MIRASTEAAHTARMTGTITFSRGGTARLTGAADFQSDVARFHVVSSGETTRAAFGSTLDAIEIGGKAYIHTANSQLFPMHWCAMSGMAHEPFGVNALSVIGSLKPPATVTPIGPEQVQGVQTTHYRVLHDGKWSDLWVDASDRLRRARAYVRNDSGSPVNTEVTIIELSDFRAPITAIKKPPNSPACV